MCTVSYYRNNNQIVFTSNRDEHISRANAIAPAKYVHHNKKLFYPKDAQANGTWFCSDEKNNLIILLNGAETKHQHNPPYNRSRGLVVIELFKSDSILQEWQNIDITGVEPFTLIVFEQNKLYKLQWNEMTKSTVHLNDYLPHIFSSSTLYSNEIRDDRKRYFKEFVRCNNNATSDDLIIFHTTTNSNDKENGLLINRSNGILTKSITQLTIENSKSVIKHFDLVNNTTSELCLTANYI